MAEKYSGFIKEIAEYVGPDVADAIQAALGGRKFYFPSVDALGPEHALSRAVGFDTARQILETLVPAKMGFEYLVPVGAGSAVEVARAQLAACVREGLLNGLTTNEISRNCGCTTRTVQTRRRSMVEAGLLKAPEHDRRQNQSVKDHMAVRSRIAVDLKRARVFSQFEISRIAKKHDRSVELVREIYKTLKEAGKLPFAEDAEI